MSAPPTDSPERVYVPSGGRGRGSHTSTKVNLVPREDTRRRAQGRSNIFVFLLLGLFVVGLGGLSYLERQSLQETEARRDAAQMEVARLQAEVTELQRFAELQRELEARNALLAAAMANEVSVTRTLNDLSLAFPGSSSMLSVQGTLVTDEPTEGSVSFGDAVARLTFNGYSIERFAPGVEIVLAEFDRVDTFFNSFVTVSGTTERGEPAVEVFEYDGSAQLSADALTERYAEGLPGQEGPQ